MRVAAAQIKITFKDKAANLNKMEEFLIKAKQNDVDLLVFPECAMNGYVYDSFDEAYAEADVVPGDITEKLTSLSKKYQITFVCGLLEKEEDKLYNTIVMIAPEGYVGKYRKSHLLYLGVDRFNTPGDNISVFDHPKAKVGMLICYDLRFPETCRVAALKGAQIIVHPTNLPKGAEAYPEFIHRTRACENRIFLVSANRCGEEKGTQFIGRSQILDIGGKILAEASVENEELIFADIVPSQSDEKHVVLAPGEYEYDIFGDRNKTVYGTIVE